MVFPSARYTASIQVRKRFVPYVVPFVSWLFVILRRHDQACSGSSNSGSSSSSSSCSYPVPLAHTDGPSLHIVPPYAGQMHAVQGPMSLLPLSFSDLTCCKAPCLRLRLTHTTSSCSCACCAIQVHAGHAAHLLVKFVNQVRSVLAPGSLIVCHHYFYFYFFPATFPFLLFLFLCLPAIDVPPATRFCPPPSPPGCAHCRSCCLRRSGSPPRRQRRLNLFCPFSFLVTLTSHSHPRPIFG